MPRRGRAQLHEQKVFFVTTTTRDHLRLFDSSHNKTRLLATIEQATTIHDATLYGYVIMSNHFHLLVRVEDGGPQLSKMMHSIKSVTSHQLFAGRGRIWQERFDDVAIYSLNQFRIKLDYIHNNPVKAGLVTESRRYNFSSASDWSGGHGLIRVSTKLL